MNKQCEYCGDTFTTNLRLKRFCSYNCKHNATLKRMYYSKTKMTIIISLSLFIGFLLGNLINIFL